MTTNQTIDGAPLLPCPFCGSPPHKMLRQPENIESGEVTCLTLDCPLEDVGVPYAVWNTRAQQAAQPLGEPVAYRIGVNGEWFYGDKLSCIRERVEYESTFTKEDFEQVGVVTPEPLHAVQPAPVAVVMPKYDRSGSDEHCLPGCDPEEFEDGYAQGWNACLDEVTRLNTKE